MHTLPNISFEDVDGSGEGTPDHGPDGDSGSAGIGDQPHFLVVEEPDEPGSGNWGDRTSLTGQQPWYASIVHPEHCWEALNEPEKDREWWWRTCDMDEWIEGAHYADWPEPPFRIAVGLHAETIRGFDWVEYDVWLEPKGGFPPTHCPNNETHGRMRLNYDGDEETSPIWHCDECHAEWSGM